MYEMQKGVTSVTDQMPKNETIFFKDNSFPVHVRFDKYCLRTPPARHPEVEIKYFVSGECVIVLDGETIVAKEGDVVVISPFQRHYTYSTEGICSYHLLVFDLNLLNSERMCDIDTDFILPFQEGRLIPTPHLCKGSHGHSEAVELFDTLAKSGEYYQLSVKTALMKLFCAIMTSSSFSEVGEKKWRTEKKYGELLRPALQYIDGHYKENIGIERLAGVCNFNPKYFCKIFKQYTSQTVMDYVNSYRLHKAELELISTDHSISDIAANNGFFDAAHFSKYYKKTRGVTPSQMRKGGIK